MVRNWPLEQNAARRRKALPGIQGTSASGSDDNDSAGWIPWPGQRTQPHEQIEQALTAAASASGTGTWSRQGSYSSLNHSCSDTTRANWRHLGTAIHEDPSGRFPRHAGQLAAHLCNETPVYRAEFRVQRKDGTYTWFESRGMVVERGPGSEPLRMIGTHVDISDRKANEQLRRDLEGALRRNQDDLEAMVRTRRTGSRKPWTRRRWGTAQRTYSWPRSATSCGHRSMSSPRALRDSAWARTWFRPACGNR